MVRINSFCILSPILFTPNQASSLKSSDLELNNQIELSKVKAKLLKETNAVEDIEVGFNANLFT
jgi:hypothetical protein